ncbi:MAG: hypothetical protein AAF490_26255 [Chloroflexota bacterium]
MIQQVAKHHNKIQFFGYEVANLILVAQQLLTADGLSYGINAETAGALFFLLGSGLIWFFDFQKRPYLLFYGGLALAFGGACFAMAGYFLTGLSVILASLETARGGLNILNKLVDDQFNLQSNCSLCCYIHQQIAHRLLGWYSQLVDRFAKVHPKLGRFIDERPFITSTLIKAPLRFEFIIKKLLFGDWIGALVGLSWLFLGDLALAFNDAKLQDYAQQKDQTMQPIAR